MQSCMLTCACCIIYITVHSIHLVIHRVQLKISAHWRKVSHCVPKDTDVGLVVDPECSIRRYYWVLHNLNTYDRILFGGLK